MSAPAVKPATTPMMAQYEAVKAAHPDCLLFFRMGDFFELFGEDAVHAAAALDIALTKRQETPMCGVPVHAHEAYLAKLIKAGFKVAICDQLESPEAAKKRGGYKAIVARDVVRIVTPGTLTEDPLLDARGANNLAALAGSKGKYALAWADISTGNFEVQSLSEAELPAALARISAKECLVPESLSKLLRDGTIEPDARFDALSGKRRLMEKFQVSALDAYGHFDEAMLAACGAVLAYIERTQKGASPLIDPPRVFAASEIVGLDPSTLRNLEIFESLSGGKTGSLLHCLDTTRTPMGARLLAQRLGAPSQDILEINARFDEIDAFSATSLRQKLRDALSGAPDIERALARLSLGRGGPRDLAQTRAAGQCAVHLRALLAQVELPIRDDLNALHALTPLIDILERALVAEPPLLARDGGFIAASYNPELDEQRRLRDETRRVMAELQARYVKTTGLSSLKIAHNAIIGYHIEISAKQAETLLEPSARQDPARSLFIHRQTLANNVRFTTEELLALEQKIARAGERALALESEMLEDLRLRTLTYGEKLKALAHVLARLDVAAGMSELAAARRYTRPIITNSTEFEIKSGRHPVVEEALRRNAARFDPNDCALDAAHRLWLITGPNMAGKSTFLRQNALIALMAQAGLFVPAQSARIGVVDRIFSRVGAGDDLSSGRSTFMVEMTETAAILHQASARSLVIVDEIGRGTATNDGLALARACLEYFHDALQCRGLFATHFHELTALESILDHLACHTLAVREQAGQIHFLHRVERGAADKSFGVHVAKLAGLPATVIKRAEDLLRIMEKTAKAAPSANLPLFDAAPVIEDAKPHPAVEALQTLDLDALSAKDALDILYDLKRKL